MIYKSTFAGMDDIMAYDQPQGENYLIGCG